MIDFAYTFATLAAVTYPYFFSILVLWLLLLIQDRLKEIEKILRDPRGIDDK